MPAKYDLEERTKRFSFDVIATIKKTPRTIVTVPLISQLIRSAASIGANYCEANGGSSKKDFRNKVFICKKEAKETKYWIELLTVAVPDEEKAYKLLVIEVEELILIFSKIASNTKID